MKHSGPLMVLVGCSFAVCGGCAGGRDSMPRLDLSSGMTEQALRPYVGQRVVVIGFLGNGKDSFIGGSGRSAGEVIYIKAHHNTGIPKLNELWAGRHQGSPIEVTGVLHLYEPRAASGPADPRIPAIQPPTPGFYFEVEEITVKSAAGSLKKED
jgi:hypothetical protein